MLKRLEAAVGGSKKELLFYFSTLNSNGHRHKNNPRQQRNIIPTGIAATRARALFAAH